MSTKSKVYQVTGMSTGSSGIYVGSGDMPDGYNVQIDPSEEADELVTKTEFNQLQEQIGDYLPKNQGSANVGKILVVGTDGNLVLIDMPSGTSGDVTGVIDENNNILLNGELADGTYTLKYENEDGTYTEIGNLVVGAITPSYTNLANPSDANWKENTRINSSYSEVTADGVTTTNYIEVSSGDVICIENMNLVGTDYSYSRIIIYNNETPVSAINPTVYPELFSVDDNGVTSITAGGTAWSNAFTHFRICGYPTGDSEDVIITINEEIV